MTIDRRADVALPAILGDLAGTANADYIDDVLVATARMRQRRASASIQRWLPLVDSFGTTALGPRLPWRALAIALIILALLVASLGLLAIGAARQLAPPFGLAGTGQVIFASGNDLLATMPDGTGRRTLVTGDGVQWGPIYSHRGDRFTYWSAPTTDDPASLWVADSDGSHPHLLTGQMTTAAADLLPEVSWSPDDRRLVFSSDRGELYVVNADGTDLHRIGERTHQRGHPVWSPDGSLIAYTGQPLADPYQQTSSWVITPDGLTDLEVIPAEGGWEMTNVDPSWSIDGRSFLVHTGGANETGPPTSISIARRDDAGDWSVSRIVSASLGSYLPAWSTTSTRFAFLRYVDGTDPQEFVVMVADADGSNVQQLSDRHVGLATPCWSPDDRFIRAAGDGTVVLFPLDGSAPVVILTGDGASSGCYMQRLAP